MLFRSTNRILSSDDVSICCILDEYEESAFPVPSADGPFLLGYALTSIAAEQRDPDELRFEDLPVLYRLLMLKDYSVSQEITDSDTSWEALVLAVIEICKDKLYVSPLISLDLLDVTEAMTNCIWTLLRTFRPEVNRDEWRRNPLRAIDKVTVPLLMTMESLRIKMGQPPNEEFIERAWVIADVIVATFGIDYSSRESKYYSLPSTPRWSSSEFGSSRSGGDADNRSSAEVFASLMNVLMTHSQLSNKDLEQLKCDVRAHPDVLGMVARTKAKTELCTLLHQAAAGHARDRRLVEWLIQMGALLHQPSHFRHEASTNRGDSGHLCNELAVHSAARAGRIEIARLLLEADNLRDLNTTTFHTKETLTHIAVRIGDHGMYDMLNSLGSKIGGKDAHGNYVYHLTSDETWRKAMMQVIEWQQRQEVSRQTLSGPNVSTVIGIEGLRADYYAIYEVSGRSGKTIKIIAIPTHMLERFQSRNCSQNSWQESHAMWLRKKYIAVVFSLTWSCCSREMTQRDRTDGAFPLAFSGHRTAIMPLRSWREKLSPVIGPSSISSVTSTSSLRALARFVKDFDQHAHALQLGELILRSILLV